MSREDILALIDNETHPVNMGRAPAVEFLEDLAGDIHQRIIKLLREENGCREEVTIAPPQPAAEEEDTPF